LVAGFFDARIDRMSALLLIIKTVGSLLAVACMLRAWAHRQHLSPHNPVMVFVSAITDWIVKPFRKLIAPTRNADWASVMAAITVAVIVSALTYLLLGGTKVLSFGAVVLTAVLFLVEWVLQMLIAILILQAILSWVNPHAPIAPALNQLTEPMLRPIRKFVPLVGGVDLSPMVLILAIYVLLELISGIRYF
jgi:YggT family protein